MKTSDKAIKMILSNEGGKCNDSEETDKILLCSNCFRDEGLKHNASLIGFEVDLKCPNCQSNDGLKLTKELVRELCYLFFVRGTIEKCEYGGFPLIQFNEQHFNKSDIDISPWLVEDVKLIEQIGEIGLFYYGPRFWMFGEVEPLKSLQDENERNKIIDEILQLYPTRELTPKDYFFRLRVNPEVPNGMLEYDTAPDKYLGNNRFDEANFPVLYGSLDLELCIHECRSTIEDNLFVGKLVPRQNLKILDLSVLLDEDKTEFESLDIAIHFLFLAGKHSYNICREIAKKTKENGFDGIIYPSYFSYVRTGAIPFDTIYGMSIRRIPNLKVMAQSQSIPNIALFGRPVIEKKISVECVNKVIINRVQYNATLGPAYHKAYVD